MLLILLSAVILEVQARINPLGPTVVNDFTNCVSQLIDTNFIESGIIIFANTNNVTTSEARIRSGLLNKIYGNLKYAIEVKIPRKENPPICVSESHEGTDLAVIHKEPFIAIALADYFILVIDTYEEFTQVASRIVRSRTWNPHAKMIILFFHFSKTLKENEKYVEQMLSCMFKYSMINVVVCVPQPDKLRNAIVYSWRAFDPPKYCGYFNETAHNRLRVENTCERGVVKSRKNMFEGKIPDSMKGCVLKILALERQPFVSEDASEPNIERYFINQIAEAYDLKTEYTVISGYTRGERNDTGVWDGGLKILAKKEGHILLGGIFPDYDVHEDFECSNTYLPDAYTWVVPRAFQSPKYIALFIIFKATVWYCVITGFFICAVTWKLLGQLSDESYYHQTFRHCFMNTWISHVGFCAYARPVKHSLRVFYVFFNLYCILFLTGYQTKLIDVLTNPTFEEQIDTVEELVNSGLKFGGFEELHDLFLNSSDPFDHMLGERWQDVENLTKALIDVAVYRNFSVLCSRLELAYMSSIIPELNDVSGNFKFFAFESDTFTVPMEMVSLRGFAYMSRFSYMLEYFKQLGVNSGVRRYFAQLNMRKRAKLLRSLLGHQPDVSPLTIQHLQGGFLALVLGYISGTVSLLIEIMINSKYVKMKILQSKNIKLKR